MKRDATSAEEREMAGEGEERGSGKRKGNGESKETAARPPKAAAADDIAAMGRDAGVDMDIHVDARLERRNYIVERIGWAAMGITAALGLLGLFGGGVLSARDAATRDGRLAMHYERFVRRGTAATLTLLATSDADGWARLAIDTTIANGDDDVSVAPAPDSVAADGGRVRYAVRTARAGERVRIDVASTPSRIGGRSALVFTSSGDSLRLNQFVYP